MAVTYTVDELRTGREIAFTGEADSVSITWKTEYSVYVDDVADPTFTGASVSPYDVVTATGIPIVNRSIYYFNSKVIPFVICRNKTARQTQNKLKRWTVTASYKAAARAGQDEGLFEPVTPEANAENYEPSEYAELGEIERVLYVDKSNQPKKISLPSGNWWSEPVIERVPTLTLKITQYETSITYEQMLERKLKTNSTEYRDQLPGKWIISHIEANEVSVQLSGGPSTVALVTYTLDLSPHDSGWKDQRVLIDNVFKNPATQKYELFYGDKELKITRPCTIQEDGTLWQNGTSTAPKYVEYQVQDEINFTTFLQV